MDIFIVFTGNSFKGNKCMYIVQGSSTIVYCIEDYSKCNSVYCVMNIEKEYMEFFKRTVS